MSPSELSDILTFISDVERVLAELADLMRWAEDAMSAAATRHPERAEAVNASFPLLKPTHERFRNQDLYRAHCAELLDRVVRGGDTRSGTAAECCVVLSEVSLAVPLPTYAAGLYARLSRQAGLRPTELAAMATHYEAIAGTQIDDLETELRHKLRQDWRVVPGDADGRSAG